MFFKKIGLPDSKAFEKMNRLGLNKISSKRRGDKIMNRSNVLPNNHKHIKDKKNDKTKIFRKSFALIMTCILNQLHEKYLFVYLFSSSIPFFLLNNGTQQ